MTDTAAALQVVMSGGVIAIPTDTVYGLACDPTNVAAVERIYAIKGRPADLELTLLGADASSFTDMVALDGLAESLANEYWPGPLSMVVAISKSPMVIPRRGSTLSIRVPGHDLLREFLRQSGPLATTSANRHGQPPANTAEEARSELGDEVDAVIDGGVGLGQASTIIDCSTQPPRILREGPISSAELLSKLTAT